MSTETINPNDPNDPNDLDIPAEALESLAIFPLPNVVLFPGGVLPLHIFEERYRDMTRDALAGSGLIAMTRIRNPSASPPEVFPIAGLGRITAARELDDGRFFVLLRGVARIAILEEHESSSSYRSVRAELRPDLAVSEPAVAVAAESQLVAMCEQLADSLPQSDELLELLAEGESPGERTDIIAAALIRDADDRQTLLETLDPAQRIDQLLELIVLAMAAAGTVRHMN